MTRLGVVSTLLLVTAFVRPALAGGPEGLEPAPAGVSVEAIVRRAEDAMRGDRTYCNCEMTVSSPRLTTARTVAFESWTDEPGRRSFIRIHAPPKDAGTGFLKLHPNLWMYVPRVERTIRVPPSMMLQSWMGSDFTNDDLVRESSEVDDYDHTLLGVDPGSERSGGRRSFVVEYRPHESAPVVWARIVAWIDAENDSPLFQEFYDEDGKKVRELRFSDVRPVGTRHVPHRWTLTPLDKPGHETVVVVKEIRYDLAIDDSVFTTRNLKEGLDASRACEAASPMRGCGADEAAAPVSLAGRLAWRNVWRNGRRTGLCVAATVFAVFLVVLSVAMAAGTHEKMIEDGVRLQSGHVVITGEGYLADRTLEHFVRLDPDQLAQLDRIPAIRGLAPRVTSYALLSYGTASQGAAVIGVDPEREGSVTTLPSRVVEGRFLTRGSRREIVLGAALADSLGVAIGDQVLVYGVAYSLETAYDLFTVVGRIDLPDADLERGLSLVTLADAQAFFVYGDRISEIAVRLDGADDAEPVRDELAARLPGVEVHTWDELMPDLQQLVLIDDVGMFLTLAILVVVVGFGILNTIWMAILERRRELGLMLALGLRPGAVFRLVYWESLYMAGIGLGVGLLLALPTVVYLAGHPIPLTSEALRGTTKLFGMEPVATFELKPLNPLGSAITILAVGALAALHPAWRASRGRPADALRTL